MDLNKKEDLYLKAKAAYYKGKEIISDFEFDELEEELKAEGSHVIDIVDGDVTEGERFQHPNPMLSLEKVQVKEDNLMLKDIQKFLDKVPGKKSIECTSKFDGSALSLIYKNGKLVQALTRGNEKGGLDRTSKARQIVPKTIDHPGVVEIRGEVVIKAALYFEKYVDPNDPKNPRNYVAGVIAREEDSPRYNPDAVKDLEFIAYHAVGDADTKPYYISNTMEFLKKNGFTEVLIQKFEGINEFEGIYNSFKNYRENIAVYQLDGIVLKFSEEHREKLGANSHHPKWALAIKFPPKEAKTTIESIHWQLGSSGKITPIAIMKPVDLDGSMVTRALMHNLGWVIENKCYPGKEVILVKSGDIIPQIIKVL